jgi:hypothetical protein
MSSEGKQFCGDNLVSNAVCSYFLSVTQPVALKINHTVSKRKSVPLTDR